ncbi:PD-(D/E)XK nuclease family protein [Sulfurimonas sp.]|uniref:PD-(D/E)XK nuclease family protein n=1 Tax=Sulfurimonas sp. TaxID=2022749 RepID=UPI0025D451CE|nr:PD-(D/E)XK nuclease family protein [Sulfurimonas sp.]
MNETTIILPSARAIRHEQLKIEHSTLFLPNYLTMSEFISKLCIVKDFKMTDEDSRVLLLLEASDFNSFDSLQIQRNFFTFTKNSSYIFKFFEELSAELYDIETLDTSDIYAEYEEHITILQELYRRYEALCNERKILDKIFLPKLYTFNEEYASSHKTIDLHAVGHLTNFELELLQKCSEYSNVNIIFDTSKFNTKMQSKFAEFLGFELEVGFKYKISLNTKEVLEKESIEKDTIISCESFSETMLQVAFVKKKVYEYVQSGYKPERIAVILPDEKFATLLKTFDNKHNFNFAMGEPYSKTKVYEKLNSSCKAIEQLSQENSARLERVGDEIYKTLFSIYYKKVEEVNIIEFLQGFLENCEATKVEKKIFNEQVYALKNILPSMKDMSIKSLISLFLQRLVSTTIDDVRGGKVTVMGVLETRAIDFDAVVIVDFSDSNVPRRSDKDMFLNTNIREMANLPTMSDRENLQKHYYEMLINSSKEAAISFVESQQSNASIFLKHLGIKAKNEHEELDYAGVLFEKSLPLIKEEKKIVMEHSFKDVKLSATKLKTFLTCKRKYYHKYVQLINQHDIPKDMPAEWEIGTAVHDALKELYSKQNSYSSLDYLKRDLNNELDDVCGGSELDKYLIDMQKRRLDTFCEKEINRFADGWQVKECEKSLECSFAGMTLRGIIDRVDVKDGEMFVLDYKTGSYPIYTAKTFQDATDFQLEFYYLLALSLGKVSACGYYDLKDSKIVPEAFLEEKLEILQSNIKDLLMIEDVNFEKCEEVKNCLFCEYKIMCGRE